MLHLQGSICDVKYKLFLDFLLQKLTPSAAPLLRPFLENILGCTEEITQAITSTVPEKDIQNMIVYFANQYQHKLSNAIEKAFQKKGFTIEVSFLAISFDETNALFLVQMDFCVISSSSKILTPFLSDKLFSRFLNIKPLTEAITILIQSAFQAQCNFAQIKQIHINTK